MDAPLNPKQRNLVTGLILIGLVIAVFFGLRTARTFRQFHGHRPPPPLSTQTIETDVDLIRDWMTLPFIARMYGIPASRLYNELGVSPRGNREKSLRQLNDQYFPEAQGIVEAKIKAVVSENLSPTVPTSPAGSAP
jgi:hypothetical protein